MAKMPNNTIVNKFALPILTIFREYSGFLQRFYPDALLEQDLTICNFLKMIDCYDVLEKVALFWKNSVQKFFKNMSLSE